MLVLVKKVVIDFFKKNYKKILIILSFFLIQNVVLAESWTSMAQNIVTKINSAEQLYLKDKPKEANRKIIQAYFGIFEDKKMEAAIRVTISSKHAWQVERLFGKMRKLIKKSAAATEIKIIADKIRLAVITDAKILEQENIPLTVFNPNQ